VRKNNFGNRTFRGVNERTVTSKRHAQKPK